MSNDETVFNIDKIVFGTLSAQEILNMGVCEINSNKLNGLGSVYDERMGVIENGKICLKCEKDNKSCTGHFGYIELHQPIIHPLYYKTIILFLKCFCYKCSSILFTENQIKLNKLSKFRGRILFNKILEKIDKEIDICPNCSAPKPKITYSIAENQILMTHKKGKDNFKIELVEEDIKKIFENITDTDFTLLGFDPKQTHPKNLVLTVLPVLPIISRPYIMTDGITCDDDLTLNYLEIVKINNHLKNKDISETKRKKYIQTINFRVKCLFDNSHDKAKHSNGRPLKSLKKRLSGKDGQIRSNIMGKRVNKSARSVIGPDPTLRLGEIAIPREMAENLTIPVRTTSFNKTELEEIVNTNRANFVIKKGTTSRINLKYALFKKGTELLFGDVIIRKDGEEVKVESYQHKLREGDKIKRNDKILSDIVYSKRKYITLNIGDIVERKLVNGDIVLLNRQPTLHKGSMLAQEIIIRDCKTIRLNLAITKTFNADFDGDEMNIHIPSSLSAESDLRNLAATKYNLISGQSSKSNIAIVQDSMLGAFLMTNNPANIPKDDFFQISMEGDGWSSNFILKKINHIRKVLKSLGKPIKAFNGKGLFSLLLPEDFIYKSENNANSEEPEVKIYRGVLYEGSIDKSIIGTSHNSIIQILNKEYGADAAVDFINNIQFITNAYLLNYSFSVGIKDCIITKEDEIKNVIIKCFMEAKSIEETTEDPKILEAKLIGALSRARDNGMKLAKEALEKDNNFISTVTSGSKGDYFNIAQITGLLGQQNYNGGRIQKVLNGRSLPHYPFGKLKQEVEYESKGFIRNSFSHGINPREFCFHSMSGREGIIDTSIKTAISGYTQRRMIKLAEDIQVKYDGTVRNSMNSIIQMKYGEDGLNGEDTVMVDGETQSCNIYRMVDRLNLHHELGELN
jgi:DNA-directed RNA polymerase beta' subunit